MATVASDPLRSVTSLTVPSPWPGIVITTFGGMASAAGGEVPEDPTTAIITASPIVAMVVEGLEVIRVVREMLGATSGLKAAAGTIRGDYSSSRQMNLVHASDGPEAAKREIALYFKSDEICEFEPTITPWLRAGDET